MMLKMILTMMDTLTTDCDNDGYTYNRLRLDSPL